MLLFVKSDIEYGCQASYTTDITRDTYVRNWTKRWRSWCLRSRKVAGSIPDEVIFFTDLLLPAAHWSWGPLSL